MIETIGFVVGNLVGTGLRLLAFNGPFILVD
jgi:hypothetical protein